MHRTEVNRALFAFANITDPRVKRVWSISTSPGIAILCPGAFCCLHSNRKKQLCGKVHLTIRRLGLEHMFAVFFWATSWPQSFRLSTAAVLFVVGASMVGVLCLNACLALGMTACVNANPFQLKALQMWNFHRHHHLPLTCSCRAAPICDQLQLC